MQAPQTVLQPDANSSKEIDIIKETKRIISGKNELQRFQLARKHLFNALDYKTPRLDILEDNVSPVLKNVYLLQTNYIWRAFLLLLAYLFMYAAFFGHVFSQVFYCSCSLMCSWKYITKNLINQDHTRDSKQDFIQKWQHLSYYLPIKQLHCVRKSCQQDHSSSYVVSVLPVVYDPQIRKMLYALFSAYIDIFVYLIFYTTIIIIFGIMANQFVQFPPNQVYDDFTGNYPELGKAIFIMYVLTTFDAYPDNQLVAIRINIWIYAFFIVFIFLNALFFVTIPTNVLLNSIKETRSKTIIIDEIQQQHNLVMAFIALGGDYMKKITYAKLVRFLLFIFNNEARYIDNISQICKSLDEKVDGTIQVTEFMQLCKIIQSKNYLRPPRYKLWKRLTPFQHFVHSKLGLKEFIKSTKFQLIVAIFVVLTFVNCILTIYIESDVFDIIDDVIMMIIVVEVMFKFIGLGPELFFNSTMNILDLFVVVAGLVFELAPREIVPRNMAVFIKMLRIFRITLLIRYITSCFKINYKSEVYLKLTKLINQMGLIIPIVLKFFPLYMISFYFLGAIGVQIFRYQTELSSIDSPYSVYNEFSNFKTLLGTQFIFVQVLTEAGWSFVAYDHALRYGTFALTMLFFVICHELIVIILTSLLKGVTWEVYNSIELEQEAYLNRMAENDRNYKALKKRFQSIQQVRQKIENQENLKPDNLISRELYEKKIDRHILLKLLDWESKNKGALVYHKKKKGNEQQKPMEQQPPAYRKFGSLLIGNVQSSLDSSKNLMTKSTPNIDNLRKQAQFLRPESAMGNESMEVINNPSHDQSESSLSIQKLKEEDIEKQIDDLLNQVVLHSGIKFSVKMQYPPAFIDYLKQKLKPIAVSHLETQFNAETDVFAKQQSMTLLAHGLHTLLDIRTSDREQRKLVLDEMVHRGIVTPEKARKIVTEKSQYDDEAKFDYDWIIRKTYLSNVSQKVVKRFQTEYFSAVYGESFRQINKVTVYPLLRVEARLHYCFSNLLRYREIRTYQFFNILTHIQNKISVNLLKRGSICKFVYQIDTNSQSWFTVQLKDSNQLRVHFIKNGLWIYNKNIKKDQIYVARDTFNWQSFKDREDKQESAKFIKRFYQSFQSLAFCIQDFDTFFTPQPENRVYDLYTFYRDVEPCKRLVTKQLSISKIMLVILSKESERSEKVPYNLSDLKYDEEQLQKFRERNKKTFRLDETEKQTFELLKKFEELGEDEISDVEGLPYSYLINFLINIREIMSLNEKNFVYHVQKLLNQHFKAEQSHKGEMKRRTSVKPRID